MKPLLTLIVAYALCSHIAYAQVDESRDFLYLYSDSVIYANRIDLERDVTGSFYLWVDRRRIRADQVKFFNNNRGFFANVRDFGITGETSFSERISRGRLNLYEARTIDWDNYDNYDDFGDYPHPTVVQRKNYYNAGFGNLKKANYVNLSIDLASNPRSMACLMKYKSVKNTETAMYVAAGISLIAGIIMSVSNAKETFDDNGFDSYGHMAPPKSSLSKMAPGIALVGLGIGLGTGGYLIGAKKTRYLKQAIDAYNE